MMNNTKIGVALVGGYLLGRTKKAKMALGLGMFLAGKKLNFDPKQLGSLLTTSQLLGGLNDQVRKELLDTTTSAATSAVTNRIGGFAESLHRRTLALDGRDAEQAERSDDGGADEAEGCDEPDRRTADADEQDDGGKQKARRPSRPRTHGPSGAGTASSSRTRTSGGTPKAASGAGRAPSGGAKVASSARRTTSGARKTASGAKKTASGAARAAGSRGGRNG